MWRNYVKQSVNDDTAAGKSVKATQSQKPEKNLYEPYSTPRLLWELVLRPLAWTLFFLTIRLRLRNRYNVPRRGPYIVAANHLSWADIVLIPAGVPENAVYMAKEEAFRGKLGWL